MKIHSRFIVYANADAQDPKLFVVIARIDADANFNKFNAHVFRYTQAVCLHDVSVVDTSTKWRLSN